MDNYIKELVGICKLPFNEIGRDFKLIQLGNKIIYVSNFIKIIDYSAEKLVLKVTKNTLEITGTDLYISMINKKEIVIKGNLIAFSLGVTNAKQS